MLPDRVAAYVGFGANLGDPPACFAWVHTALNALPHTTVRAASPLYRTAPQGCDPSHPDYTNAVLLLDTALPAPELLDYLLRLEREAGRIRPPNATGYAPRPLDLDLLLYGDTICATPRLTLPHPRMHQRAFVLVPLADIAPPDLRIPGRHATLAELLPTVADQPIARL